MSKKDRFAGFLLVILMIVLTSSGCTLSNTPRRSLSELRTALLNHDADTALRYIDVDSVVDAMVRDIFLEYEAKADNPIVALGLKAGRRVTGVVMPGVRAIARCQVRTAITSDDQWGYFEDIRKASVWYLNIRVDGDMAVVEPKGRSSRGFKMFRAGEGHWKIIEIIRKRD